MSGRATSVHAVVLVALLTAAVFAQSVTVSTAGGAIRVRSGFSFIEGAVLDQLRDGRSLRLDLELTVLNGPRGDAIATAKQSFNLSFDLWEERIAATRLGTAPRAASHLRPRDAEAWCLEHLVVPATELGRLGQGTSFWIKLDYSSPNVGEASEPDSGEVFTLRRLIDVLSRRTSSGTIGRSTVEGPFRLGS